MPGAAPHRVRSDVAALVQRGLSVPDFARAATRALRRAVPFDGVCVLTLDPATLLPTSDMTEDALPPAAMDRLSEIELGEPDYTKFRAMAHGKRRAASLSGATGGRLDLSLRQREVRAPSGFEDELRAVLVDDSGIWGALTLLRGRGTAHFSDAEVRLVDALTRDLADGLRRAILLGALTGDEADTADAGLIVLRPDASLELTNAAGERWLDELGAGGSDGELPRPIKSVATGVRVAISGDVAPDEATARLRVRTRSGRWALVRGSLLGEGATARVAVIVEEARGPALAPLIADAYGLTERERLVTQLVACGLSTDAIARHLLLSPYTVQDHLKAIFEKTGSASRGELVARLFFEHYAPCLTRGAPLDANGWFAAG